MMGIRIVLLSALLITTAHFLRNRESARIRAGKKLLFLGFVAIAMVAVIVPDALTAVARLLDVGRGADLLLYLLVIAFLYMTVDTRLRISDLENRLAVVVRWIALESGGAESEREQ
jgi:hypothetical protein